MDYIHYLLIALIVLIIIYLAAKMGIFGALEGYTSKREKAQTIVDWFTRAGSGAKYSDYKAQVPDSDILDYLDAKALGGALSVENMEKRLI
jgi:hypothetical protein